MKKEYQLELRQLIKARRKIFRDMSAFESKAKATYRESEKLTRRITILKGRL